jgi:small subunit ribosomal protein S3e
MKAQKRTKARRIIETGLFYAELNELLTRELASSGYGGCEVRVTPSRTEIIIKASDTRIFTDNKGRRLQELRVLIQKRWNLKDEQLEVFLDRIQTRGLSALNQLESLRYKILSRIPARRAAYSIIRFVMEAKALGCEVVIAGKMRSARAQALKFRDGYMVKSGDPKEKFVVRAVGHIPMKQAVVGIRVSIMLPTDPKGIAGPKEQRPDLIIVSEGKP